MPSKNEEVGKFSENLEKDGINRYWEVARYFLLIICFIIAIALLILVPFWQVNYQGVTNNTDRATLENQYRATLAQIFGGIAVLVGIYFAWENLKVSQATLESNQKTAKENLEISLARIESDQKTAQKNIEISLETLESNIKNAQNSLEIAQEGQINERFTRAIDQLGNDKMEIRLGGIYALERIALESEHYDWPIMEILSAYVRKNSSAKTVGNKKDKYLSMDIQANESRNRENSEVKKVSLDIEAILTVITKREFPHYNEEGKSLDLKMTQLEQADLIEAHLEGANLEEAHLEGANLEGAYLKGANLTDANLEGANLLGAHLEGASLLEATLEGANLTWAHLAGAFLAGAHLAGASLLKATLEGACLEWAHLEGAILAEAHLAGAILAEAHLEGAFLAGAHLEGASLEWAHLEGALNLTIDQLSKVKTLYKATLDPDMETLLREKYPALFNKPANNNSFLSLFKTFLNGS